MRTRYVEKNKGIPVLCLLGLFFALSSCVTQSKVEYLLDENTNAKSFTEPEFPDYRLKPNDELYIQVNSLDEGAANIFSNISSQPPGSMGSMSPYGASLISYSVNKDGYLQLPVVGNIYANGKTLSQIHGLLKDSLNHMLNQPIITVKLVNRFVSVLGEVNTPGHFPYSQDKLTVFDALGLAGDISEYGNRNEVILVRNENNENLRINLDLTRSDILSSNYYYMRPNDIIYVKPLKNKFWGMRQFPFTVFFSTVTTALLIYNVLR